MNLSNESSVTIDLSSYSFAGSEPASTGYSLNDAELADFLDAISEADAEGYPDTTGELSDAELNALMRQAESGADYSGAASPLTRPVRRPGWSSSRWT